MILLSFVSVCRAIDDGECMLRYAVMQYDATQNTIVHYVQKDTLLILISILVVTM